MDNVNINDILSSLSNDDIEMLKGVAGSILNQSDTQSSAQPYQVQVFQTYIR